MQMDSTIRHLNRNKQLICYYMDFEEEAVDIHTTITIDQGAKLGQYSTACSWSAEVVAACTEAAVDRLLQGNPKGEPAAGLGAAAKEKCLEVAAAGSRHNRRLLAGSGNSGEAGSKRSCSDAGSSHSFQTHETPCNR